MFGPPRREDGDLRGPLGDWGGLRSWLTWLGVAALGAAAIVASGALIVAGGFLWDRDRRVFHRIAAWWGRTTLRLFPGSVELRGLEHLAGGPYVLAPNHQSMVDLLALYHLPGQYRTVVKRSWLYSPFGLNIWSAGYVPTPKKADPRGPARVVEACADWLERGIDVLLFPEGTRSRGWHLLRFKRGAFELSARTGHAVVPIAIAGTNDISHPSSMRFCLRPLKAIIEVMPPIPPAGRDADTLKGECHAVLTKRVAELRAELLERFGQGPS